MSERLFNWLTSRGAGVLLHPTSLPGTTGIGTLGRFAFRFVDFLADLEELLEEGFLEPNDLEPLRSLPETMVDYGAQWQLRWLILQKAFEGFRAKAMPDQQAAFADFRQSNREWLEAYCLFMAIKSQFDSRSWQEWPPEAKRYPLAKRRFKTKELKDKASAY